MSEVTITGLPELKQVLRRLAAQVPTLAGDTLETQATREVRSREKVSGWRQRLDITREGLEVRVSWPYPHEGGEGTYVERVMTEVARLLPESLERELGSAIVTEAK
jgi:hypothetical protein